MYRYRYTGSPASETDRPCKKTFDFSEFFYQIYYITMNNLLSSLFFVVSNFSKRPPSPHPPQADPRNPGLLCRAPPRTLPAFLKKAGQKLPSKNIKKGSPSLYCYIVENFFVRTESRVFVILSERSESKDLLFDRIISRNPGLLCRTPSRTLPHAHGGSKPPPYSSSVTP